MESHEQGRGGEAPDTQLVVFVLDEQRYAVPLRQVERIVRAVEVRPLPEAPPFLHGAVNVQGRALPVVHLRRRFGLPERPIDVSDHFVIARGSDVSMILPVDNALGSHEITGPTTPIPGGDGHGPGDDARRHADDVMRLAPDCVRRVMTDEHGMIFVLDLDRVMQPTADGVAMGADLAPIELW